jgi:hypothetical protein
VAAKTKVRRKRYPKTLEGDELTPEVLEALADEAERGYDLSEARRVLITKPMFADEPTMGKIVVHVTNEEGNRLRERAEAEDRTIAEVVFDAAMQYLDSAPS